ncbi:chromo domain protein LHP1 isoform X4 [Sesamum indicum]|uniref:Chromo domain protein LHP1 isoform X4 n=1 Tax=Sesamum indicum TaxID=4182 RepID=A0A6I9U6U3_SESIN|nr:chromo domain protein LHP1 isoform X4 [Sesamum indicum]
MAEAMWWERSGGKIQRRVRDLRLEMRLMKRKKGRRRIRKLRKSTSSLKTYKFRRERRLRARGLSLLKDTTRLRLSAESALGSTSSNGEAGRRRQTHGSLWRICCNARMLLMHLKKGFYFCFYCHLKAGKSRSTRKRKRKTGVTHVQTKKKQHHQQQRSPAAATYNVPSHVIRIAEEPLSFPRLNDLSGTNESGETNVNSINSIENSKKVIENGARMVSVITEYEKEQNELDLKICELKGAMVVSTENANRLAITSQESQLAGEDALANGLRKTDGVDPNQLGRCIGAKKRKSGSVKRFMKDPTSCSVDDALNGDPGCASLVPISIQHPDFLENNSNCKNTYEDSKSMCTITQIVRPISYKASVSNNVQEVLVAFEAVRSDGTKVTVDNKFLKANNPLLLIDFYEKHLRYSPT